MSAACANLHRFVDGELDDAEASNFRQHLGVCPSCPTDLEAAILVDQLVEEVAPPGPHTIEIEAEDGEAPAATPGAPAAAPRSEARASVAAAPTAVVAAARGAPIFDELAARRSSRRLWISGGVLGTLAAAAVVLVLVLPAREPDLLATLGEDRHRSIEGRLSYPGLDRHRPLARERGGLGAGPLRGNREQTLAALEERQDEHGLAVALLLEGRLEQASRRLAKAGNSAAVISDAAALAIERGDAAQALALADRALTLDPKRPQALWNRAVALEMLGRRADSARAFAAVVALGEPGWSEEARTRARAVPTPIGSYSVPSVE